MKPCPRCGGEQIPLFTGLACKAECDLKEEPMSNGPRYGVITISQEELQKSANAIGAFFRYQYPVTVASTIPVGLTDANAKYGPSFGISPAACPRPHPRTYQDPGTAEVYCWDCGSSIP